VSVFFFYWLSFNMVLLTLANLRGGVLSNLRGGVVAVLRGGGITIARRLDVAQVVEVARPVSVVGPSRLARDRSDVLQQLQPSAYRGL
jgi:hypothetical protein